MALPPDGGSVYIPVAIQGQESDWSLFSKPLDEGLSLFDTTKTFIDFKDVALPRQQVVLDTTSTAFNRRVSGNTQKVVRQTKRVGSYSLLEATNFTLDDLFNDLIFNFQDSISKLKTLEGTPFNKDTFREGLKNRLFRSLLDSYDVGYLQTVIQDQENLEPISHTFISEDTPSLATIIEYIKEDGAVLDRDADYSTYDSERLRLWWTRAGNIFARLLTYDSNGNSAYILADDADTIALTRSDGTDVTIPVNRGFSIEVTANGVETVLPLATEKKHAYILNNQLKSKVHSLLDQIGTSIDFDTTLSVCSTIADDLEFANYESAMNLVTPPVKALVAAPSTFSVCSISPYVNEVSLDYDFRAVDTALDKLKFVSNWKVFCIDYHDPIWFHIRASAGRATVKFRNFTTDTFAKKTNINIPIVVEEAPYGIFLVATDREKYNPHGAISQITEYGSAYIREIKFEQHFDKRLTSLGLKHPIMTEAKTGSNKNVDNAVEDNSIQYSYNSSNLFETDNFKTGSAPTREKSSLAKLYDVITSLNTNYDLTKVGTTPSLTWFDILSRMNAKEVFNLTRSGGLKILKAMQAGHRTGCTIRDVYFRAPAEEQTGVGDLTGSVDFTVYVSDATEDVPQDSPAGGAIAAAIGDSSVGGAGGTSPTRGRSGGR